MKIQRYFLLHITSLCGLVIALVLASFLVWVQFVEGLDLPIPELTLVIIGILFGIMMSQNAELKIEIKKLQDKA